VRSRVAVVLASLALVPAGLWAYSTSFAGVFLCDDGPAIVDNPHIKALQPLGRAMTAPPEVTVSGRPIASLTLALNYALAPPDARDVLAPAAAGPQPDRVALFYRNLWGYHFVNLMIHLAAGLALFGVMRRTMAIGTEAGTWDRWQERGTAQPASDAGARRSVGGWLNCRLCAGDGQQRGDGDRAADGRAVVHHVSCDLAASPPAVCRTCLDVAGAHRAGRVRDAIAVRWLLPWLDRLVVPDATG